MCQLTHFLTQRGASTSLPTNDNAPIWNMPIEIYGTFLLGRVLLSASEKMHLSENLFIVLLYVALMKHQHSFHVEMYFRGKDIERSLELICHLPAFIILCKLFCYSVLRVHQ